MTQPSSKERGIVKNPRAATSKVIKANKEPVGAALKASYGHDIMMEYEDVPQDMTDLLSNI